MSKLVTHFVRVALEGDTIDGREITADQINQMAESYKPKTYGARIWIEHLRGVLPNGLFPALGDVVAAKAEDYDGRRALYNKLAPNDYFIQINKNNQKVYTSIEMDANFVKTGKAYQMGLAVTDTPASLATEMLRFSHAHKELFKNNVEFFDNLRSNYIELSAITYDEDPESNNFMSKMKNLLNIESGKSNEQIKQLENGLLLLTQEFSSLKSELNTHETTTLDSDIEQLQKKIDTLMQLSKEPEGTQREPTPGGGGGGGTELTDC